LELLEDGLGIEAVRSPCIHHFCLLHHLLAELNRLLLECGVDPTLPNFYDTSSDELVASDSEQALD
jgi:hypothetical protein